MTNTKYNGSVLFVDDEKMMLQSIQRSLMDESFKKYFANNAEEALMILKLNPISVLVTDLKMPGMSGMELIKIVKQKYPEVVRIVLTAYYQVSTILNAINTGHIHRYLTKPWKMEEEFLTTIHQAIEYHNMLVERKQLIERLTLQNKSLKQKNDEIVRLKELAEASDENKTKILSHITRTILPYIKDVVHNTEVIKTYNDKFIADMAHNLNKRGVDILILLQKLEKLLRTKR